MTKFDFFSVNRSDYLWKMRLEGDTTFINSTQILWYEIYDSILTKHGSKKVFI